jgi:hypothetical protein
MVFEEKVKNAVRIFRHVATTGEFDFSPSDAMKWAGLAAGLADSDEYKASFALYQRHVDQKLGPPPVMDDDISMSNRFRFLWHNTVDKPEGVNKKGQALVMELAGFCKEDRSGGSLYQKCRRMKPDEEKEKAVHVDVDPIYSIDGLNDSRRVSSLSDGSQGRESQIYHVTPQGRETFRPPTLRRSLSLDGLSRQIMSPLSTGFSDQSSPSSVSQQPSSNHKELG